MSDKKTATVLRSEIDNSVLELAARLKNEITVDTETGNVEFSDNYQATILGEDNVALKKELDKKTVIGADATHLVVGEAAIDAFKANPELEQVSGLTGLGGQSVEVTLPRTGSVRNVSTGESTAVFLPGATKVVYRKPTSKASFKRVRTALQALAAEELG